MKTVYFIRHAKSSWSDLDLMDHDRPLNKRGLRDAPFMAKILKGKGVKVDLIYSSNANRALTTAKYFIEELGLTSKQLILESEIYEAWEGTILKLVKNTPNEAQTILVFGHNPTFTSIANFYSSEYIPNLPTCGIVKVECDIESWSSFSKSSGVLTEFHYPKQYFH